MTIPRDSSAAVGGVTESGVAESGVAVSVGSAPAGAAGADRPGWGRRLLAWAVWGAATVGGFAVYLRLASTRAVDSDGASQALQAWDMVHGNLLLGGWMTSDVSFFSTEVPQYALIELAHGLNQDVVHIAAAMTYTLVLLFAALLAAGRATGREAAVRIAVGVGIMLAPQLASGTNELLSSPDHIGTAVPLLLILLVIDRAGRRPRWWLPAVVAALIAWADLADSVVLFAAVIPLTVVCAFRVARSGGRLRAQWLEIALAAAALAGLGLARLGYLVIRAAGGYAELPLGSPLAPLGQILRHNLTVAAEGLLLLPGADFLGLRPGVSTLFVLVHLVGVAAAAAGIALGVWRFGRRGDVDLVSQLLLAGILINVIAYVVSTKDYDVASAREMAPALPFASVLAGRVLGPYLVKRRSGGAVRFRPVGAFALGVVLAGYLAGLGLELTTPAAPPQNTALTTWLERHPLGGAGLSGYWASNVVTLTSGGRVAIRSMTIVDGRIRATPGNMKASWFNPARSRADFVVLFHGITGFGGFTDRPLVLATFGTPARTYHVGQYTILWWPKNLLTDLRLTRPRAAKPLELGRRRASCCYLDARYPTSTLFETPSSRSPRTPP